MKDDLISRKTVRDGLMKYGFLAPDMTVHEFVEDELPTIPAVPLEPLCNFLAAYAAPPIRSPLAIYGSLEEAWKAFLIDWMEEQNAAD